MYNIHNQKFGVEVEFSYIRHDAAMTALANYFGTTPSENQIFDSQGRIWQLVFDGTIRPRGNGDSLELISPVLTYEDIDTLQGAIRALREAGAQSNRSCGLHVHVNYEPYGMNTLENLLKYYAKYEDLLYRMVNVHEQRHERFVRKMQELHPTVSRTVTRGQGFDTLSALQQAWYGNTGEVDNRYDPSRYTGLNLHNLWHKSGNDRTIEFRLFNGSIHAGKIRSYIILALAMSAHALNTDSIDETVLPYDEFLNELNITSDARLTRNVRQHLERHFVEQPTEETEEVAS